MPDFHEELILASSSPFRKQLLEEAGYRVRCVSSGVPEPALELFPDLDAGLMTLAHLKARQVMRLGNFGWILGGDTVSLVQGQILGKPTDEHDARRMLKLLSGCRHEVRTGWTLLRTNDGLHLSGVETTTITMRVWTEREFDDYLGSGEWRGKCGAYGLQWPRDPFVTDLQGSPSNVIGLPLERLEKVFDEFGIK